MVKSKTKKDKSVASVAKETPASQLQALETAALNLSDTAALRTALAAFSVRGSIDLSLFLRLTRSLKARSVAEQQSAADAMLTAASLHSAWHARLQVRKEKKKGGAPSRRRTADQPRRPQCGDASVLLAWLYAAYASSIESLQRVVLAHVPLLVWLHVVRRRAGASAGEQDAVLLSVFNHVVALRHGAPLAFNETRRSTETIYHRHTESTASAASAPSISVELTESALLLLSGEKLLGHIYDSPLLPAETITAGNAGRVLTAVLRRFVDHFTLLPPLARQSFCNLVTRLCLFGLVDAKAMPDCEPPLLALAVVSAADSAAAVEQRDAVAGLAKAAADAAEPAESAPPTAAASSADAAAPVAAASADDAKKADDAAEPSKQADAVDANGNKSDEDEDEDEEDDDDDERHEDEDSAAEREMARLAAAALQERHLDLDKGLLQCFVEGVHMAVFDKNDAVRDVGRSALAALHRRAVSKLDAKLLLSTSALLHSIKLKN